MCDEDIVQQHEENLHKKFFRGIFARVVNKEVASSTSGLGRSPLKAKTRVRTSLRLPEIENNSLRRNNAEAFIIIRKNGMHVYEEGTYQKKYYTCGTQGNNAFGEDVRHWQNSAMQPQ